MRLWLCVCLATLIQAQQNYYTTTESADEVYPQTQEVERTTENSIETTNEQEPKTTESAKEIETTQEESAEPTTTATTTVSTAAPAGDLVCWHNMLFFACASARDNLYALVTNTGYRRGKGQNWSLPI